MLDHISSEIGAQDLMLSLAALSCASRRASAGMGISCPFRLSPPQSHTWLTVKPGEVPEEGTGIAPTGYGT